jgi:hypothetical protein
MKWLTREQVVTIISARAPYRPVDIETAKAGGAHRANTSITVVERSLDGLASDADQGRSPTPSF